MNSSHSTLFDNVRLKALELPSRFVLPGMQRGWSVNGAPTDRLADFYVSRVRGGVGLVITESVAVDHPSATASDLFSRLDHTTFDAWANCVGRVREAGGNIILQLWHEGAIRNDADCPGGPNQAAQSRTLSPSGFMAAQRPRGRAATVEELQVIKQAFVRSALLAQAAGAQGIEIHAAHGYLLDQFLWKATNRRTDRYGGPSILDRARFPLEIVRAIRETCGQDFLISFRFSQWKEIDLQASIFDGPDELQVFVLALKQAGVDVLHVSTRRFWEAAWPHSSKTLARWARDLSGLPVITVGSVGLSVSVMETLQGIDAQHHVAESIMLLERALDRGDFDLVAVGRGQIGDPDWVHKAKQGRFREIIPFTRHALGTLETETDHLDAADAAPVEMTSAIALGCPS